MFPHHLWLMALTASAVVGLPSLSNMEERSSGIDIPVGISGPGSGGASYVDDASPKSSLPRRAVSRAPEPGSGHAPTLQIHFTSLKKRNELAKQASQNAGSGYKITAEQEKLMQLIKESEERTRPYNQLPYEPHVAMTPEELDRRLRLIQEWISMCQAQDPNKSPEECVIVARDKLTQYLHGEAWSRERRRQQASSWDFEKGEQRQKQPKDQGPNQFSMPAAKKGLGDLYSAAVLGGVESTGQLSRTGKTLQMGSSCGNNSARCCARCTQNGLCWMTWSSVDCCRHSVDLDMDLDTARMKPSSLPFTSPDSWHARLDHHSRMVYLHIDMSLGELLIGWAGPPNDTVA
ncbi:MAG: hypothetical protein M1823_000009 [Watsoniomyces obsoletus]|nr:MAG: hypothetical protein M1823_000009 [Watsoniomyces obsoletus]